MQDMILEGKNDFSSDAPPYKGFPEGIITAFLAFPITLMVSFVAFLAFPILASQSHSFSYYPHGLSS